MKMKTGLYWLANIFLPLSEARYTKNKIIPSFAKQLQRMRVAKKLMARRRRQPGLSWAEAVAASGMDTASIARRQLRRKRLYLVMAGIPILLATGLLLAAVAATRTSGQRGGKRYVHGFSPGNSLDTHDPAPLALTPPSSIQHQRSFRPG